MAVQEIPTPEPASPAIHQQRLNLRLLEEAEDAFIRDLPSLLETWPAYWVAYHGKERLGISYYIRRLETRFALPPVGRRSLWERLFGSTPRYPDDELSLYFVDSTLLQDEFEITSEQWDDGDESPLDLSSNGQSKPE